MGDITEKIDIVINESGGRTVKRSLDDIADSAQRGVQPVNQLNSSLGSGARAADIFFGSLKALSGILATIKLTSLITEAATLSQRYSELGIVLDVVGRNAGLTKTSVDATAEAVRKQGISMIESRQIVTRMIQSQIDLSKATELARLAQDAAVIGQMNSSQALDTLVHGIQSAQVDVLRTIGINVNFEQSYAKLAKQMGVTQNALTENEKLQSRLNVVLDEASKISGVYEGAMANAGKQMRSTQRLVEDLKVKVGGLFDQASIVAVTTYTDLIKDLDASVSDLAKSGELKDWSHRIAIEFAGLMDLTRVFIGQFGILGNLLSTQFTNIKSGNFGEMSAAFSNADIALKALYADGEKYQDQVNNRVIQEGMLTDAVGRGSESLNKNNEALRKNTEEAKKDIDARNRFIQALQTEVDSIGLNEFAIKRMEAAKLGATKAAFPLIDALEEENKRLNLQSIQVNQITSDLNKYKQVTESVKTDQEKFSDIVEELNRLRNLTNGAAISQETYNRALKKANDEFLGVKKTGNETFDALNQYAIQASRNIQTSLANFLFDPFNDGLDGMVKGVANAVRRMIAEFAAMKIANATGLSQIFNTDIGGTSSSGSNNGSGFSFGNILSSGSNLLSSFGGGVGSLIGRGASALGFSSFGAGASGAASAGVFGPGGLGFLSGGPGGAAIATGAEFGSMATAGAGLTSGLGAIAGPVAIAAVADMVFRSLAGNKTLGNKIVDSIPIVGSLGALLFGHGPLKQKETQLVGDVGISGLSGGSLTTNFKAKGGLISGSKHDAAWVDLMTGIAGTDNNKALGGIASGMVQYAKQVTEQINQSVGAVNTGLRSVSGSLDLSTKPLDDFHHSINLISESGKALTDEQIGQEIAAISDEMVKSLMPSIDQFSKSGETSIQTISRLGVEFDTLSNGAVNLGASVDYAKQLVKSMSIEARTAFVDMAGGPEALGKLTSDFANNFLTDAQRLAPIQTRLSEGMKALGYSADITKDQFTALVQDLSIPNETRVALLKFQYDFLVVNKAAGEATKTTLSNAFGGLQKSVETERKKITDKYNADLATVNSRIQGVNDSISKLNSLSAALKSTTDTINPQSLSNARDQIRAAISSVAAGNIPDSESLKQSLDTLSHQDSSNFATLADFQRSQAQSVDLIDQLNSTTGSQLTLEERSLAALEANRDRLQTGFDNEMTRLDSIISQAQQQIDLLTGIDTSIKSLGDALGKFNVASVAAGGQTIGVAAPGISYQVIRDYSATHTPDQIYAAAKQYGFSQADIVASGAFTDAQINDYLKSKGLASFDIGGRVPKTGLAMIHKNEQVLTPGQQDAIASEIQQLRDDLNAALALIVTHTSNTAKILDDVSVGGNAFLTEAA